MSQKLFEALTTPATFADWSSGVFSQSHGMAAAWSTTCLSIAPHAAGRWSLGRTSALSIASLTAGTSSSGQLELPCSRMFLPLKVGQSMTWPSAKSLFHATFGHTATFADGVLQ